MHTPSLDLLFKRPGGVSAPTNAHRTPFSFTIPKGNDRSILLGNRYLNRGDGMVVSSSSGMGKSSFSMQAAGDWALGMPFFGIAPNGPLRILVVQSEDSDGDIAEVWQSLAHAKGWNPQQRETLEKNIRIISERSLRGVLFINWLRGQTELFKPDLVIINPLQAFIDGDVTDSRDIGAFLREGLNGINRDSAFGYLIIHHTTKPATGKERSERLWHEVMYDMAGGAEIINWARAIISLRATETPGHFKAVLAKRGVRAGVTREVTQGAGVRHEPVTEIGLKHSDGFIPGTSTRLIHWEAFDLTGKESGPDEAKKVARASKHQFSDYRPVFPTKASAGLTLAQLQRVLAQQKPISRDALFYAIKKWIEDCDVEVVPDPGKPDKYRAAR
jgi:hypothetical protein